MSARRALVTTLVAVGVLLLLGATGSAPLPLGGDLLLALPAFAAGRRLPWRGSGALTIVLVAAGAWPALRTGDSLVPLTLMVSTGWAIGYLLGERERVVARLAARGRELETEREAYTQLSVRYERARIASELHDIVAHAISVIVVQATAGQRLTAAAPELAAEAMDVIAVAARQAEQDIGLLVALLDDEPGTETPDADLELVHELVARAAGSGVDVTLRLRGDCDGLGGAPAALVYGVVREGLTNAMRYAAGAAVQITIDAGPNATEVRVVNATASHEPALSGAGTGNGLRGLRERLGARGGRLEAGPAAGGCFVLRATVPR